MQSNLPYVVAVSMMVHNNENCLAAHSSNNALFSHFNVFFNIVNWKFDIFCFTKVNIMLHYVHVFMFVGTAYILHSTTIFTS